MNALPPTSAFIERSPLAGEPVRKAASGTRTDGFPRWLLCWVLLPNLPYLPVTLLGGPPRYPEIAICAAAGLAVRRAPYWLRLGVFLTMVAILAVSFIARMFNMNVTMILSVVDLLFDISPAVSPEYVAGAALIALSTATGCFLLRGHSDFAGTRRFVAALAVTLALAAADFGLSREAMGSYSRLAPADASFTSATKQVDLAALADGKTHVLVIMVEAMGNPVDPALRARLNRIWDRPELSKRYDVVHGRTPFFGSTTSGEMRELCQRWGDYSEVKARDKRCLPARLAAQGYETRSVHAFTPSFFDRQRWYPLIGFQRSTFGYELIERGAGFCPNVFPGACDRDVPPMIGAQLSAAKKPQFLYWLTLNSHLPVIENRQLGTEHCARLGPGMDADFPMICRLFAIWQDMADSLVRTVMAEDFPPTHILIVGDHMPPFTHQRSRLQFDAGHVPWVLLRYRHADGA